MSLAILGIDKKDKGTVLFCRNMYVQPNNQITKYANKIIGISGRVLLD